MNTFLDGLNPASIEDAQTVLATAMVERYKRKMASVQKIAEVKAIPEADRICAYRVNGWWIVDQVGKYQVDDLVVYCEIDSFIPNTVAPFLTKPGHFPKVYNGVEGEKLRTIRLRKQVSQGLLISLDVLQCNTLVNYDVDFKEGDDVSVLLGIVKWEAPPEFTSADARGTFPSFIIKTDQERIQNCYGEVSQLFEGNTWEETEKCEGSSMTVYFRKMDDEDPGVFGVASRNLDLKENHENTFWKVALDLGLKENLRLNVAIQGELCGPGIQGNIYNLTEYMFFVFDVFDIDKFEYYSPEERRALTKELGLTDAPVLHKAVSLTGKTREELLKDADGQSVLGTLGCLREGKVYKLNAGRKRVSFKCVSDKYLEKQKD